MFQVSSRLNDPARKLEIGGKPAYSIQVSTKAYSKKEGKDKYYNYGVLVFPQSQKQVDYYEKTLVKGTVVTVSCMGFEPRTYVNKQGETVASINLVYPRIESIYAMQSQQQNSYAPQQNNYQQPPQQTAPPQQQNQQAPQNTNYAQDDDDIPF